MELQSNFWHKLNYETGTMITPSAELPLKKNINKSLWSEVRKLPALSLMKYRCNEWVITLQGTVCVEARTQLQPHYNE